MTNVPTGEDAELQLAFTAMHPDRRFALCRDLGGAGNVLRSIWAGTIPMPAAAVAATRVSAGQRRDELDVAGVQVVRQGAAGYPPALALLEDAPSLLFLRGTLPTRSGVAIVGTRRATAYGIRLATSFGHGLARDGRLVVSGLAKGIDAAAHRGVVDAGGDGVAVLGCGIDRWYPASSREVGAALLERGAIVSEYPPGTPPAGWRFPPRNRIIVGLASVVVVVEAGMPGGAMITARLASEHGRDVFAVPGDVDRESSVGCNLLIRDGAWPVFGTEDLREAVDRILGAPPTAKSSVDSHSGSIVSICGETGTTVEALASRLSQTIPATLQEVTRLELDGVVRVVDGRVLRA